MQERFREYFQFSAKERAGIAVLVVLIILAAILPLYFDLHPVAVDPIIIREFESRIAGAKSATERDSAREIKKIRLPKPFPFDPNKLDEAGWRSLGLKEKTAATIMHWKQKGGRFRKPEDLRKIYGLEKSLAEALIPFVHMAREESETRKSAGRETGPDQWRFSAPRPEQAASIAKKWRQPIDINQGDSSDFESLAGIGPRLAARIVLFRQKLGGFYSLSQVGETYGLSDSVFLAIRPMLSIGPHAQDSLRKTDINQADINALRQHPYIGWKLARAIVEYRNQHGPYRSPDDLAPVHLITDSLLIRLRPYLVFSENRN